MAKLKYEGTGIFKYGLDVQGQFPLDSRIVVSNASDLTNYTTLFESGGVPTWYVGMTVFAEDTKKLYVLQSEAEGFAPVGADLNELTNIFSYKGTKSTYEDLPDSGNVAGDVWNVESEFSINLNPYPAGTNVVWNGESWDALGGSIDLSGYATKSQINDIQTELNNKVEKVDGAVLVQQEKVNLIDANADAIKALKAAIGLNPDGTPGDDASLETRVGALEVKAGNLDDAVEGLNTQVGTNSTNIGTLNTRVSDLETAAGKIEGIITLNTQQTEQISKLSTDLTTANNNIAANADDILTLNTTVGGHTSQISSINDTIAGLTVKSVDSGDKILANTSGVLSASLSLEYASADKKIQLKGIGGKVISEVDAGDFVKDGMLSEASYDKDAKKLVLTWNADAGNTKTEIEVGDLVDTYTASDGLIVSNNEFSLNLASNETNNANLLVVENDGKAAVRANAVRAIVQDELNWVNID